MPLLSFSEPFHIPLLLDGRKTQTTRRPRKNPPKVGDVMYCYFKPRQRPGCTNCIIPCPHEEKNAITVLGLKISDCSEWNNYFGEAVIVEVEHFWSVEHWPDPRPSGESFYRTFGDRNEDHMERWARCDGFASLQDAHKWFERSTKNSKWMFEDWDVITFKPSWISTIIKPSYWVCGGGGNINCDDWDDVNGCWRDYTDFVTCPVAHEFEEDVGEEE